MIVIKNETARTILTEDEVKQAIDYLDQLKAYFELGDGCGRHKDIQCITTAMQTMVAYCAEHFGGANE